MKENISTVQEQYFKMLSQQTFKVEDMDYSIFEAHKTLLDQMAVVNNSGLTVFDLNKKQHVYSSFNFFESLGYKKEEIKNNGNDYFTSKIHPEDLIKLNTIGVSLLKYSYSLPIEDRKKFKLQNEYRVLDQHNKYKRVIEQHITLELDKSGNFWLILSITDISPNQNNDDQVISQLVNIKTGETSDFSKIVEKDQATKFEKLTKREAEILELVKIGSLSKEISNNLSISVHTVNTHRQKILQKLNANNSFEAIGIASKLGFIS